MFVVSFNWRFGTESVLVLRLLAHILLIRHATSRDICIELFLRIQTDIQLTSICGSAKCIVPLQLTLKLFMMAWFLPKLGNMACCRDFSRQRVIDFALINFDDDVDIATGPLLNGFSCDRSGALVELFESFKLESANRTSLLQISVAINAFFGGRILRST